MIKQTQFFSIELADARVKQALINEVSKSELLRNFETLSEEELLIASHVKHIIDRRYADPSFREQLFTDPYKAARHHGLKVNPEEIRPLWDKEFPGKVGEEVSDSTPLKIYRKFTDFFEPLKQALSKPDFSNAPLFELWRERQIARAASQFKDPVHKAINHFPFCFELSKGCSVGCWFCGVSAPRLGDIFVYNQENAKLWHEVLELMKEILGPGAGLGFCYWATDPLDNPDYEKFCSDFHKVLGTFPPTTTAQPLKDPVRTRALLKLSREKGRLLNSFSILSLKTFNQVYEEFTPEELLFVRLTLQNQEADVSKANSGRVRRQNTRKKEKNGQLFDQETIACVTGFLFNMVDRSVKLISPCIADERWPLGYRIYDEGTFSTVNELESLLKKMINNNMPSTVRLNDLVRFRPDLKYESLPDGFQLSTKLKTFKLHNEPYLKELGEVIHKGDKTAVEISCLFDIRGISSSHTLHNLDLMFKKGILDDEPTKSEL